MALTYKDVADIIRIIDASQLDEVIVELADTKIVVRRGAGAAAPQAPLQEAPQPSLPVAAKPAASAPAAAFGADDMIVRSPMTGTFYRAPSPKDPPFVEPGSVVKKGDTLCTIEVMKLFTTILAETGGRVSRVFAENAALVQIDQPLFRIEPA